MAKKQDTIVKVKKEVKEERVLYVTILELREHFGQFRCRIQTPNDIVLITERQALFDRVLKEFREKVAQSIPAGTSEEDYSTTAKIRSEELMYQESSVLKKDLQFFTFDQFLEGIKDRERSNLEVGFLSYWFVKPEKDETTK